MNALDRLVLDALADARALPMADNSVGMVLFADLVQTDEGKWTERKNDMELVMHTPSEWMKASYNDGRGSIHDSVFQKPANES